MTRPLSGDCGAEARGKHDQSFASHGRAPAPARPPGLALRATQREGSGGRGYAAGPHGSFTYLRTSSSISSFFFGLIVSSLSLR